MAKHRRTKQKRHHPKNRPAVAEAMGEKVLQSGTLSWMPGEIPSVTGGKSPAMDLSEALLRGDPKAHQMVEQAMGGKVGAPIVIPKGAPLSDVHDAMDQMAGKPKDEASVADKFLASTYDWCKYFNYTGRETKLVTPILMAYRQAMRQAHKFVLDNEFVEYATSISNRMTPAKLLARLPLATLPYETTWIEFDLRTKVRVMRSFHGLSPMPDTGYVAQRMGVLLERINETMCTITMVCEGDPITTPNLTGYVFSTDERTLRFDQPYHGLTPFDAAYRMDRLKGMPVFEDITNDPDAGAMFHRVTHGALWGFAGNQAGVINNSKEFRIPEFLERHGELAFTRFYDFIEDARKTQHRVMDELSKMITTEMAEFTGMMRWLVIVLAMLNEVPTRANFIQPMHTMRAGLTKRIAAFEYHRLTLRLPKTKAIPYLERKLSNVERRHKAHEVRQHWRTYLHAEQQCLPDEHAWEYDEEHGYALCGKCMGYRRRIPEHVRGDPSLGWVRKDYVIKPSKQE
jgi:hypothetical protein